MKTYEPKNDADAENMISDLMYMSYRHQRNISPEIPAHKWAHPQLFGEKAHMYELQYQRELARKQGKLEEKVVDYESKYIPQYGDVTRYSDKHKDKHLEKVESFKEKAGDNYHSHEHDDTDTHHVTIMHYKNSSPYEIKTKKHSYKTRQIIGHIKNPNWFGSEPMMRESTFDRYRRVLKESESFLDERESVAYSGLKGAINKGGRWGAKGALAGAVPELAPIILNPSGYHYTPYYMYRPITPAPFSRLGLAATVGTIGLGLGTAVGGYQGVQLARRRNRQETLAKGSNVTVKVRKGTISGTIHSHNKETGMTYVKPHTKGIGKISVDPLKIRKTDENV